VSVLTEKAGEKRFGALIVDDEELARQVLRELVQTHPEIQVLAECANGFEAVKAISEHKPDLMFLDVQMPKLSGFDVLELIEDNVAVIFVTAYDQYATKAFEVHAVDYLLKPIGRDRFEEALERVNRSDYGLQAGVFTRDAKRIFQAFDELEVGGVMAGEVPSFRIDHMPYGGVKDSGLGREGLRYAMEEMTEPRILAMNLR